MFFPQRIWFPLLFLVWTLPSCFFLSPRQSAIHNVGNLEDVEGYVLVISLLCGSLPKTWKIALLQFFLPPTVFFQLRSLQLSHEFRGNISLVWGFLSIFSCFIFSFLFFFKKKKLNDVHPRSNVKECWWHVQKIPSQQFLEAIFLKVKPQIPADIVPYEMVSHRDPERHLYLQTSCELKRLMELFESQELTP